MCGDTNQETQIPMRIEFKSSKEQHEFAKRIAREPINVYGNKTRWVHYDHQGNQINFTNA